MFSADIRNLIQQAFTHIQMKVDKIIVEIPVDKSLGDYSTSVAFLLAKKYGMNPMSLAQKIVDAIPANDLISSVQAVAPGFINFTLKPKKLLQVLSREEHIIETPLTGKDVTVEFSDPNPFKVFHIGHLLNNTIGESISRLLEATGSYVRRVCYQGDVGIHVACSIWGMIQSLEKDHKTLTDIEQLSLSERVFWLGQCYAHGATEYKENEDTKKIIQALNTQIFHAAQIMWKKRKPDFNPHVDYRALITKEVYPPELIQEYYEKGRQWTLDYFETIYARLGTRYANKNDYYFESYVGELGYELIKKGLELRVFEKSNGAIVFKGEPHGLHTRVFINSLGLPTYEAKELGLNPTKYQDKPFDISIIVTANEIEEYFKVVLKAMSFVAPDIAAKTKHLPHGMVKLPEGKMSSRTGKIISGEVLLDEVEQHLIKKLIENKQQWDEEHVIRDKNIEEYPYPANFNGTAKSIALAAVKYSFLKSNVGKDIIFNFDDSLSFEGNSGPYLLYTIVRCKSILAKVSEMQMGEIIITPDEPDLTLLRHLIHFSDVVAQAATQYAPHLVCTYLHKLAQDFNSYYDKAPILKAEEPLRTLRLQLVQTVEHTLTKGIHMLGFKEVEKM